MGFSTIDFFPLLNPVVLDDIFFFFINLAVRLVFGFLDEDIFSDFGTLDLGFVAIFDIFEIFIKLNKF